MVGFTAEKRQEKTREPQSNNSATTFLVCLIVTLFAFAACEGTLNERVGKVTETIKKVDSASVKVAKGLTEFTKQVEGYVDTTAYKKDSTGIWHAEKDSFLLQQQQ